MEEWVGKRQRARRRTAGTQRMTRRAMVRPRQRREGQDVLEAEEQGVVEDGLRQRRQRVEEEDEHERAHS